MSWTPDQPNTDLPKLSPRIDLESAKILMACTPSRTALTELKQAGELLSYSRRLDEVNVV